MSDDSERWVQPPAGMRWASEPDDQKRKDLLYHDGRRWVDYPADAGPFITDHRYFAVGIKKPAVPEGVWISVDDAMPEGCGDYVVFIPGGTGGPSIDVERSHYGDYVVFIPGGTGGPSIDVERSHYGGNSRSSVWADRFTKGRPYEITHWMKVSPPAGK